MKKQRIGFVSWHNCIRAQKEATILRELGYHVHCITGAIRQPELYITTSAISTPDQLRRTAKVLESQIDIFHVHNEPNWMVPVLREALPNAKIVFDYHDSNYWRLRTGAKVEGYDEEISWYDEDIATQIADAYVVPSMPAFKELETRADGKPIALIPSANPVSQYQNFPRSFRGGLVSQGGHIHKELLPGEHWRNYTEIYKALVGKVEVFAYAPNFVPNRSDEMTNHYMDLGVNVGSMKHAELLKRIGEHTWALVGNLVPEDQHSAWQYILPNKLFDAVAACTPVAVFNCPAAEWLVKKYDIGIICKSPQDLIDRWSEHKQKRTNLALCRRDLSMDAYVGALLDLYDGLTDPGDKKK